MNGFEEKDYCEKVDLSLWKRLWKYASAYPKLQYGLMALLLGVALIDLIYPLLTRYAVDTFIRPVSTQGLGWFGLCYGLLVILQGSGVYLFICFAGKLEMNIAYDIRQQAFTRLQELSFSFYDTTPVGYLLSRMVSDIGRLSEMIAWSIVDLLWALFFMLGTVIVLFALNLPLAALVCAVLPPLVVVAAVFQQRILKQQREVRKNNSKITSGFNEGIMGAVTTKTLVREQRGLEEFSQVTGSMRRASIRSAVLSAGFMPLVLVLGSLSVAMVLYRGGSLVLAGAMGFGTLSAFISYATQLFEPAQQLARILAELQSAQAAAERVITLLDTEPEIADTKQVEERFGDVFAPKRENWPPLNGEVEFEHVSFRYQRGEPVLEDFSLKVRPGETIALVGETGAGKSTIVNLVCRFYEPTKGRILIDGVDYRERSLLWLQSHLGYVLQTPHLFSGTIGDNIRYGCKDASDEQVRHAAAMVHADEFINALPQGYDTQVGEGGARLSTGQKQLISFARVMLADPRLFVLDEATSSIDTETEQLIQNAITHVLEGRTAFIVAHRLSTIRSADRILVIREGRVTEQGTHRELLALGGYYHDLYYNQFREDARKAAMEGGERG